MAISILGTPIISFSFEDGELFLNVQVFDEKGDCILWIDHNEMRYGISTWDVEWVGRLLQFRSDQQEMVFEVRFSPPDRVEVTRGYIQLYGYELLVHPKALFYLNNANTLINVRLGSTHTALNVGENVRNPTAIAFRAVNPYFRKISREETIESCHEFDIPLALKDGKFVVREADLDRLLQADRARLETYEGQLENAAS